MSDNSNLIADVLQKTDPDLYAAVDGGNSWKEGVLTRGARVDKYRKYERGDHDANLTEQMRKMLRLSTDDAGLEEFNDNYCRIVVEKMAGRLSTSEIATDEEAGQEWIGDTLERNDWDALEGEVFRGAVRDGDSYVIVDPLTMKWAGEPAYDGFNGVVAIYDEMTRDPIWACKLWSEANNDDLAENVQDSSVEMKIVVYQPKRITYWTGTEFGAHVKPDERVQRFDSEQGMISGNEQPWPVSKLPLEHFVNQKDNYTSYGESEIRPAIPLQNVLNRTLHSMVMASELSAFKIYWSIGMEIEKDGIVPGSVINMVVKDAGGNIVTEMTPEMTDYLKTVKVGEFQESDISNYTEQIDTLVREISQATQTPIYGITGTGNISGEALKQLEIGLIGKVKRFQRENNSAIRSLINLTSEMQSQFSIQGLDIPEAPEIDTVAVTWKTPEIIDVTGQIQSLTEMREKAPGLWPDDWYREQIGRLLDMTQKQIKEQGEAAVQNQSNFLDRLVGADGTVPVV